MNRLRIKLRQALQKHHKGIVTLTIATSILMTATLLTLTSSKFATQNKNIIRNDYASKQAFEAAESGLQYALGYLNKNHDMVKNALNTATGLMNSDHAKMHVNQNNGTSADVVFENPTPHNTAMLKITATGTSQDNTVQRTIKQKIQYQTFINPVNIPTIPMVVKGPVIVDGTPTLNNPDNMITVWAGGTVTLNGNPTITNAQSGNSNSNGNGNGNGNGNNNSNGITAIQSPDANLSTASATQFFRNFFGDSQENIRRYAQLYYHYYDAQNANIDGINDSLIWVEGDLSITGHTDIGSLNKPVILVVNGNLSLTGNTSIYGLVFVTGDFLGAGTSSIVGVTAVTGTADIRGTAAAEFNTSVIQNVGASHGAYVRIPGSWMDG